MKHAPWLLGMYLAVVFVLACSSENSGEEPSSEMPSPDLGSTSMDMGSTETPPTCARAFNTRDLKAMVDACLDESPDGDCPNYANDSGCGPIGTWDTSRIDDMTFLFAEKTLFNQDIGDWNVSYVRNMSGMFANATAFNADIGRWNTENVSRMNRMFDGASSFNQDIGGWNVAQVKEMNRTFANATAFNADIGGWDVGNVELMEAMFSNATSFNQDIGNWNMASVYSILAMFEGATAFNQNIGRWNVSRIEIMERAFKNATAFNGDIGGWNPRGVFTMLMMFEGAESFNQDIGNWDVGHVEDMRQMFERAFAFNQDLGNWNVSTVDAMDKMFERATSFDGKIQSWDVSNVRTMNRMFKSSGYTQDLSCWDLSSVAHANDFGHSYCEIEIEWPTTHSMDCVPNGDCLKQSCDEANICAHWLCDEGADDERCVTEVAIMAVQRWVGEGNLVYVKNAVVTIDQFPMLWIQEGDGPYSGVAVVRDMPFSGPFSPGDRVSIIGYKEEFYGNTQIRAVSIIRPDDSDDGPSAQELVVTPVTVAQALDEAYEGVLVSLTDSQVGERTHDCTAANSMCTDRNLWTIKSESTGDERLVVAPNLFRGGVWDDWIGNPLVTGVLTYRFDQRYIMPRYTPDFQNRCGDGIQDPEEVCDDGNNVTEACLYGEECVVCAPDCTEQPGIMRVCGDGIVDPEEVCDESNDVNGDGCDTDCQTTRCDNGGDSRGLGCFELPDIPFVSIPGGTFQMGTADPEIYPFNRYNAVPIHEVTVPDFEMSETEVTNGQYRVCVDAGVCPEPEWDWPQVSDGKEDHPVQKIFNWHARIFARFAGARLPTEAEWEYAAKSGGQDIAYPWGNESPDCSRGNVSNCAGVIRPVCSYPLGNTIHGLCDMAGNVAELVEDDPHGSYDGAPTDGSAWLDEPIPCEDVERCTACFDNFCRPPTDIHRGGHFQGSRRHTHTSHRLIKDRDNIPAGYGFRLARSVP
ncbi:MAG: BspA family leucine-rich repeat surface protein [Bradymonadia bacterium]